MSRQKKSCPCGSGKTYRDCCWAKDHAPKTAAPSALSRVWLPALALAAVPIYVVLYSTMDHDFAHRAFWAQNDALNGLSTACWISAALTALIPSLRRAAVSHLESLSQSPRPQRVKWLGLCLLGIAVWFGFIRYCEYRSFLLPTDTANFVQSAYVFLHFGHYAYPAWDMNILSQHFDGISALFSPALLLWNHPLSPILAQNLFISVLPLAAFAVAFSLTSSALAGFVGLLLTLSAPSLYEMLTANPDVMPLAAFFLGAMYFLRARRWTLGAACLLLMVLCKEQAPFLYFGMGLYCIYALRERKPWNWAAGLAACAGAIALWRFEMSVIAHFQSLEPELSMTGAAKWAMFAHLAPPGTPGDKVLSALIHDPLLIVRFLFSSRYIYYPLLRVLLSMGFLCLLAPFQMLPFAAAFAPHLLANGGAPVHFFDYHPSDYFDLGLHHPSYMMGPLIWATAYGISRAYRALSPRGSEGWLLAWSLAIAGLGFRSAHRTLNPNWRASWFDAMPRIEAEIPPKARVWVDEYAAAPISNRRWLKLMQWGPDFPPGYRSLFKPDYVLFDKAFVAYGKPPYRDRLLTFFAQNNYAKIADDHGVVLLRSPEPAADPESTAERVELPQADAGLVNSYGRYVLGN